jgi:hypothetical protein
MKIRDEDPRLVSLAVAMGKLKDLPIGVPSPGEVSTPGCYFGAIRTLKYLVVKGVLNLDQVGELLTAGQFKLLGPPSDEET